MASLNVPLAEAINNVVKNEASRLMDEAIEEAVNKFRSDLRERVAIMKIASYFEKRVEHLLITVKQ